MKVNSAFEGACGTETPRKAGGLRRGSFPTAPAARVSGSSATSAAGIGAGGEPVGHVERAVDEIAEIVREIAVVTDEEELASKNRCPARRSSRGSGNSATRRRRTGRQGPAG